MKKIPTLFEREFKNHKVIGISDKVTNGMEWVLSGEGVATEKIDGSCCAIINGQFYRRYDAKRGRVPPKNAIPCCEPDSVTGHWPHWVLVDDVPENKWFIIAWQNTFGDNDTPPIDGTYEAIGRDFQGNPYCLTKNVLVRHGQAVIQVERSFEGIREYLRTHDIEGIVFWKDGEPQCKIKRSDFGFSWPLLSKKQERLGCVMYEI